MLMDKPILIFLMVAFCVGHLFAQKQYITQVPNPGFENWPGAVTSSPPGWHSFDEASGIFSSSVSNKGGGISGNPNAIERVSGHSGKYACVMRCTTIFGVAANGALTCGRINMSAMGASSPKNYTYTDRNNGYAFRFTGRPDSVYFWAKFSMKGDITATAKAHLHTDCDFRDFVDIGQSSDIASAILNFRDAGNGHWYHYKQAFKAFASSQKATADKTPMPTLSTWTRRPSYMLFSFSTNRFVEKGSRGDALYIDDIRLVYNKALSCIELDGESMMHFNKGQLHYTYYVPMASVQNGYPVVTAEPESSRATVEVRQASLSCPIATVTVYHDDVYNGEAEPRVYTIQFVPIADAESVCK